MCVFFFLMIRRPPRSTLDRSSAASDVYKRQAGVYRPRRSVLYMPAANERALEKAKTIACDALIPVSYTHLRAHETVLDLVCRLLLEKKRNDNKDGSRPHAVTMRLR